MPRHEYTAVPNSRRTSATARADVEMDDAFQSDDDEDVRVAESTPLTQQRTQESPLRLPRLGGDIQDTVDAGNRYDFENVYDHPPPGSPPPMSHMYVHPAIGNSNGFVPSPSTVQLPASNNQPSFLRRAVGVLLPTHYNRIPTSETNDSARGPTRGGGIENDGVFSNVLAKPTSQRSTRGENGDVHVMPEESQKDAPPSYASAQADAVPPYWETTIVAPHFGSDDILIDGLPSGSVLSFAWNFLISVSFQYVGFMLTYLMHTTHAAKYGSRAGLGVTLIQYGLLSRADDESFGSQPEETGFGGRLVKRIFRRAIPDLLSTSPETAPAPLPQDDVIYLGTSAHDWLSFFLMTIGWFLLLSSFLGYARVKRWERSIRSSTPQAPPTPDEVAQEAEIRARLQDVYDVGGAERSPRSPSDSDPRNAQLVRMLRESGFL